MEIVYGLVRLSRAIDQQMICSDEVRALLDDYEQFLSEKASGTRETYLRTVHHLIGWETQRPVHEGPFQPQQLTQTVVDLYPTHLEHEGCSLTHRAQVKSTIGHFAQFLIEENELFQGNPTHGIALLPERPLAPADGPYSCRFH